VWSEEIASEVTAPCSRAFTVLPRVHFKDSEKSYTKIKPRVVPTAMTPLTASTVAKPSLCLVSEEYKCSDIFDKGVHRKASHGSGGASNPKSSRPITEGDDERDNRDDALDCIEGFDADDAERNRAKLGSRALKELGESGVVDVVVTDLRDMSEFQIQYLKFPNL